MAPRTLKRAYSNISEEEHGTAPPENASADSNHHPVSNSSGSRSLSSPASTDDEDESQIEPEHEPEPEQDTPDTESDPDPKIWAVANMARVGSKKSRGTARKPRSDLKPAVRKRAAAGQPCRAQAVKRLRGHEIRERNFTEEDDIAILRGLMEFLDQTGSSSAFELPGFHQFIAGRLSCDPSVDQLSRKITRLKTLFRKYLAKEVEEGASPKRAHQQRLYQVAKHVWGGDNPRWGEHVKMVKEGRKRRNEMGPYKGDNLVSPTRNEEGPEKDGGSINKIKVAEIMVSPNEGGLDGLIERLGTEVFGGAAPAKGAEEWRQLVVQEIELHRQQKVIMAAKAKLVHDVIKFHQC